MSVVQRSGPFVAVLLAIAALALDILAFTSRCTLSPGVNVSLMIFGAVVQTVAICFPIAYGIIIVTDLPRRGAAIIGMAVLMFVGGSMAFRYAVLYPDAIGQPNFYRSASLKCGEREGVLIVVPGERS